MKSKFTVNDVPEDVQKVWVIKWIGQPVGMKMYEWIEKVIAKYPEWFLENQCNEIHNSR